jgi:UDP-glucose 4-epimerase
MRVLVTGATGFLGGAISTALAEAGHDVVAGVRDLSRAPEGCEPRLVILQDHGLWEEAVRGCDAIVHAAGLAHVSTGNGVGDEAFQRVNVRATESLLAAAGRFGVRSFVHLSSVSVFGEQGGTYHVDSPVQPGTPYARSKLDAEIAVSAASEAWGLWAPVLRLPMTYGPGMKGNPLRLFRLIDRGLPLPFGDLRARRSVLYSGNLSAAVIELLTRPCCGSPVRCITDGAPVSTADFVRLAAEALDHPARMFAVPASWLHGGGLMASRAGFRTMGEAIHKLTREVIVEGPGVTDSLPYTTEQGISRTAEWYRMVFRKR